MRPSRWPVRARLTALYAAAFLAAGVALVAVTYWLVSRSLTQHIDPPRPHLQADARLTELVRNEIDAYRSETLSNLLTWSTFALVGALGSRSLSVGPWPAGRCDHCTVSPTRPPG